MGMWITLHIPISIYIGHIMSKDEVDEVNKALRKKKTLVKRVPSDYLNTGSTMLNLLLTGRSKGGFIKGKYYFLVGDSDSGKTFLSLTCLAEASINEHFDDYRFIFDDVEGGALMDLTKFFGTKMAERIESPGGDGVNSSTIEEFYFHVDDAIKDGRPFIYILDSMDALSSEDEISKFKEQKTAYRKGKESTGSYGDGKAKKNSSNLRKLLAPLDKSKSILIIINQTRDDIGKKFGFGDKKTRSGGKVLKFYASGEMWSSVKGMITKDVKGKRHNVGIYCELTVKKNRITGKKGKITIPIYHSYGMDDIGSCIKYLVEAGHWKGNKLETRVIAPEFDYTGSVQELAKWIEENNKQQKLKNIASAVYKAIEESLAIKRKPRYE